MMSIPTKLVTVDEFETIEALPENRDRLLELIHGRIVEKVPTQVHGFVAGRFFRYLDIYSEEEGIDGTAGVEVRHQLPEDKYNSRMPDVSFQYVPQQELVDKGAVPAMPDLAIEVQSPDDSPESLRDRIEYYLRNGTRLGWIAYPKTRKVEACVLENGMLKIEEFSEDDTLDGGDVLPGFKLPVSKVFPKK
jgi:Uma2 family endonuclease